MLMKKPISVVALVLLAACSHATDKAMQSCSCSEHCHQQCQAQPCKHCKEKPCSHCKDGMHAMHHEKMHGEMTAKGAKCPICLEDNKQ